MRFPPGKLPNSVLEKLLAGAGAWRHDPRVLVGPQIGEDAAVLDFGEQALVVTSDPITFATEQAGWYAVQVNANDIAVRGARPRWFIAVVLLPEQGTDDALVTGILDQIQSASRELGCALIGGHTEITLGLDRPIIIGQMLGETPRAKLVTTGGAQVGDTLLLTKGLAIEGTSLLARELGEKLSHRVSHEMLVRARHLLFDPGISIVREALLASGTAKVHAMHDPTEGGLATGIAELAQASGTGVHVYQDLIPILPETQAVCDALDINPLGLLASGSLLIAAEPGEAIRVVEALVREKIPCARIGELTPREEGLNLVTSAGPIRLPAFSRDEVARILS